MQTLKYLFPSLLPLQLALFSPNDVALDPIGLCQALAGRTREYGNF